MKILVFDTCFNKSYIVLADNDKILGSKIIKGDDRNYHSVYLIPEIRNMLKNSGLFIKDLDAIGINIGPGSFTGIRVSAVTARVMCMQFNIKLIGIPSLEILACLNKQNTPAAVILDARKSRYYFGVYENGAVLQEPVLKSRDELISCIKPDYTVISDASSAEFLSENNIKSITYEDAEDNLGLYLLDIVKQRLQNEKNDFNWAEVKPLYLQKPSVTMPKDRANV